MSPPHSRFFYRFSTSSSFPDHGSFHRHHWHRRPSRLVWFAIGAASATFFIMHKEAHKSEMAAYYKSCYRHAQQQSDGDGDSLPTVPSSGSPSTQSPYPYSHPHHPAHWSWGFAKHHYPPPPPPLPPVSEDPSNARSANISGQVPPGSALPTVSIGSPSASTPPSTPPTAPPAAPGQNQTVPWGFESRFEQQKKEWEQEREKLLTKAQDTMAELSESTLDSLSSTVEALKAKLAEHRVKREEEQKRIEEELQKQKSKPVRYV